MGGRRPGRTPGRFGPVLTAANQAGSAVALFLGQDVTADPVATTTLAGEALSQIQSTCATLPRSYANQSRFAGIEVNDAEGLLGAVVLQPGVSFNGF